MASFTVFLLVMVTGILCLCAPAASGSEAIDLEALSSFKLSLTSDPLNALVNWANHTHHCNWSGVACDSRRNVVSLILPGMRLEGVISPFIGNISYLTYLDLSSNSFQGTLPSYLGNLGRLQSLSLGNNVLVGDIPDAIGNCASLTTVSLPDNKLSGPIPSALGGCKRLLALDLSSNALQGMIPANISQLLNLEQILNLSNNRLKGEIPAELGRLSLLSSLDLSSNVLSGRIPSELGNLTKLRYLNFSGNQLEGPVPQMGVLASFNWSSFEGNDKLCGVNDSGPCSVVAHSHQHRRHAAMVASVVTVCVFLALIFCLVFYCFCLRGQKTTIIKRKFQHKPKYTKSFLQERTDSFNAENIIRSSSGSIVYKGGNISVIIYKVNASREINFFYNYVDSLMRIRHRNLLSVLGFCYEDKFKALVTEYEPNGDLDTLMHAVRMKDRRMMFDLSKRIDVLISTAGALIHLHEYCDPRIVHCHLNPTNICVDEHFRVRVSDFGTNYLLQDHLQQEREASSAMEGTISYLAPELEGTMTRVSAKADVFSLGVILMEMLTGRRAPASLETENGERISLRMWIEKGIDGGSLATLADPTLLQNIAERESDGKKIANLFEISLLCTEEIDKNRPSMSQVLAWFVNIKNDRVECNTGI